MKLLRFAFLLSLTSVFMYAQRGGGGHAGGGGGHAMGGGGHMSSGGGMSHAAPSGGMSHVGGISGNSFHGTTANGFNHGFNGSNFNHINHGFVGNHFHYGYPFVGFGFGFGYPFYGYPYYGYPYYGYGSGYPGYYSDGYSPYDSYGSGYTDPYAYNSYGDNGYAYAPQSQAPVNNQYLGGPTPPVPGTGTESFYRKADYYLIAFADHTIQAALSYRVEGDTIFWTTREHEERHAPLSSVDRRFTEQMNRDRHVEIRLQ